MNVVKFEKQSNKTLGEALKFIIETELSQEMLDTTINTMIISIMPEDSDAMPDVIQYAEKGVDLLTIVGLIELSDKQFCIFTSY